VLISSFGVDKPSFLRDLVEHWNYFAVSFFKIEYFVVLRTKIISFRSTRKEIVLLLYFPMLQYSFLPDLIYTEIIKTNNSYLTYNLLA